MAKKRKATAPPPKPNLEETQKTQLKIPKIEQKAQEEEQLEEEYQNPDEESSSEEEEEDDQDEEEEESEDTSSSSEDDDDEDLESKKESLKKLLEPFGKEQIIDFLKEAALKDPSIITRITKAAESDPSHRKIFVYGLGWDATQDQVTATFKPFGEIEECRVVTDKVSGRAKGYAFVLFKTLKGVKKALKQPQKKIGNRLTTCQLASAGGGPASSANPGSDLGGRKLFVANVGPQVNSERLKLFFAKYGEIEEGPIGCDPITGKFKGYAIFMYKTVDGCKKALEEPIKLFEGCQLQCRHATEGRPSVKTPVGPTATAGGPMMQQQNTVPAMNNYGLGLNPGFMGQGFNPAALMMVQNQGIGLTNPLMGLSANGLTPSMGVAGSYGINSYSPSVMGSYGTQAALQGLGPYQTGQLGQSSVGVTTVASTAIRPQLGLGSAPKTYPSFGR